MEPEYSLLSPSPGLICRATTECTFPTSGEPITLRKGDAGFIEQCSSDEITFWLHKFDGTIKFHPDDLVKYFESNGVNITTPWSVNMAAEDLTAPWIVDKPSTSRPHNQSLVKLLETHFETWSQQTQFAERQPYWIREIMQLPVAERQKRSQIIEEALEATGAAKLIMDPNTTFHDFLEQLPKIDKKDAEKGGIYIQFYWKRKDDKNRKLHIIIGSTLNFHRRYRDHCGCYDKPDWMSRSTHYKKASRMEHRETRKLAERDAWSEKGAQQFHERLIVEQMLIGIFGTYRIKAIKKGLEAFTYRVPGYDRRSEESRPDEEPTETSARPDVDQVARSRHLDQFAAAWSATNDQANQIAGWTPILQRKSFGDGWVPRGLNRHSPLSPFSSHAGYPSHSWLRRAMVAGDNQVVEAFQRVSPARIYKHSTGGGLYLMRFKDHVTGQRKSIQVSKIDDGPKEDDWVHITLEVMPGGRVHPLSYVGLPLVGPFTDWEVANSVAIRLTWTDKSDGLTKFMYLRRRRVNDELSTGGFTGATDAYVLGKALYCYIKRLTVAGDAARHGALIFGKATVRDMEVSWYDREITIGPLLSKNAPAPAALRKDPRMIKAEMEHFGLERVGTHDLSKSLQKELRKTLGGKTSRKSCDYCGLHLAVLGDPEAKCHPIPFASIIPGLTPEEEPIYDGLMTCEMCARRGLMCSWTAFTMKQSDIMKSDRWLVQDATMRKWAAALVRLPAYEHSVVNILDFTTVEFPDPDKIGQEVDESKDGDGDVENEGLSAAQYRITEEKYADEYEERTD